jgi:hypothetical protein
MKNLISTAEIFNKVKLDRENEECYFALKFVKILKAGQGYTYFYYYKQHPSQIK